MLKLLTLCSLNQYLLPGFRKLPFMLQGPTLIECVLGELAPKLPLEAMNLYCSGPQANLSVL